MERDDIVAGGCSGPATVDLTGDRDDDSWDKSYAILREVGLAAESDVAGSSESHDTPLVDDSGITKTDAASFDSFNFQNDMLRWIGQLFYQICLGKHLLGSQFLMMITTCYHLWSLLDLFLILLCRLHLEA